MKRIRVKQLFREKDVYAEKEVTICGWVRSNRAQAQFGFLNVNDGSFFEALQIVYDDKMSNFSEISKYRVGVSVLVKGIVKLTPDMKQPLELHATYVEMLGDCPENYPIQPKRHTKEFLREVAHLRPRTNLFSAVFRIRSVAAHAIHTYFQERNYLYVHTPLITCADCEGSDQMFKITTLNMQNPPLTEEGIVDYSKDLFGKQAFITGSGQLQGETYAMAFGDIYTFGPTFRTENSNTKTHANEFWMIEPEMAFYDLDDNMDIQEDFVKYLLNWALTKCQEDLAFFDKRIQPGLIESLKAVANAKFTRISYTDAIAILEKDAAEGKVKFEYKPFWGCDIATEHERYLTEKVFNGPVMVYNYPKEIKAFYMKLNEDGKTVKAVDVLVPGIGELIGGSEREENYEVLLERIKSLGLEPKDYDWYLDLRRFGTVPHSGFGLGFERLIRYVTGMENIRDVIPFPRAPKLADF